MQKTLLKHLMILCTASCLLFSSSCKDKDDDNGTSTPTPTPVNLDGDIKAHNWTITNAMMPTGSFKSSYSAMDFSISADNKYTWKLVFQSGSSIVMTGDAVIGETTYKHTNGSKIRTLILNVYKIDGQPGPPGMFFQGLFTFEGSDKLILNVEDSNPNRTKWPSPSLGIGSGSQGAESVLPFKVK